MAIWDKGYDLDAQVARFTVGNDYLLDQRLVPYDCRASRVHAEMLERTGVLTADELAQLLAGLEAIEHSHARGEFVIRPEDEDCHTAIERVLTERCGDAGRKIHTARSRNDQVLTALRLYEKEAIAAIGERLDRYRQSLATRVDQQGAIELPGYTHMRKAMPTTVACWLGCFVEASQDDERLLRAANVVLDQSPLGTAAGFGVPVLDVDRQTTTAALGFDRTTESPLYAQLGRGKLEAALLHACSQILLSLNRLASDLILFSMTELGFVVLPDELCTGSSIMPQKKNPDVLELVRGSYHVVLAEQHKLQSLVGNLMSGYHRDGQLGKEPLFASLDRTQDCLDIMTVVVHGLSIDEERCREALTEELYATERAYELVAQGVPFRDAYRRIGSRYVTPK
ncbi:MAG: argininosuccinate lyase [Deltaproteobacteria bacterium]|jgi:argininosuccinate lyase|nr:argininosuccinate lyase [Deltaproteobacteria bacterium]MBW2532313.1 argininosuccinate lyase [Deltaproteobacteria bacterium]